MKRGLTLIAGALVVLGISVFVSTRLIQSATPATAVATLKQAKLNTSISTSLLNQPRTAAATIKEAELGPASCSARLGSITRCT
jgi:hypothetical protein